MGKRALQPAAVRAKGSYSPGWEVSGGRLVFVAGQIPWDAEGRNIHVDDVAGQTRQVIENIRAVLAEAGATLDDVVKITIWVTDRDHRVPVLNEIGRHLKGVHAAYVDTIIKGLATPELLMEVDVDAVLP